MNTNQPRARFMRTLLAAIGGYAVTWAGINWTTDYRAGAALITVNLVGALIAASIAGLQALRTSRPRTVWGKTVFTFAQNLAGGLGTVVLAELTREAVLNFTRGLVSVVIASALAALATLGLNASESG